MTEADITRAVVDHWRKTGLTGSLVASIPNAYSHGQAGLTPGLPDLLVIAPGLPMGFIELKTEKGEVSEAQWRFGQLCEDQGIPHAVTRGRDEPIEILERWGAVRRAA